MEERLICKIFWLVFEKKKKKEELGVKFCTLKINIFNSYKQLFWAKPEFGKHIFY